MNQSQKIAVAIIAGLIVLTILYPSDPQGRSDFIWRLPAGVDAERLILLVFSECMLLPAFLLMLADSERAITWPQRVILAAGIAAMAFLVLYVPRHPETYPMARNIQWTFTAVGKLILFDIMLYAAFGRNRRPLLRAILFILFFGFLGLMLFYPPGFNTLLPYLILAGMVWWLSSQLEPAISKMKDEMEAGGDAEG